MTWFCYNCPELRWIYVDMFNMNINVFFASWCFLSVSVISIFLWVEDFGHNYLCSSLLLLIEMK